MSGKKIDDRKSTIWLGQIYSTSGEEADVQINCLKKGKKT